MPAQRFEVRFPDANVADLRQRLGRTRLPPASQRDPSGAAAGLDAAYLAELLDYFRDGYDFRKQEAELNRFAHFRTNVRGTTLHYIHERGRGDAPLPLLLLHGFPDSVLRYRKLIPRLADPVAYGGDPRDAFDVVVPSLPGYGFSATIDKPGAWFQFGSLFHELMTGELGYERFGVHGGDWGSTVGDQLARSHPASVIGLHLTDVPFWRAFQKPRDASPAEAAYLKAMEGYLMDVGAYAAIQGTRPQTLADGLNDSPAGLTAWLVDLFQRFSDSDGDVETRFDKDELLTNVALYWFNESIGSSFLPYRDFTDAGIARWLAEKAKEWLDLAPAPAGFALFPKDLSQPPKEWAERFYDVKRWTSLPRGGHFAALEEPDLLAGEIREFFRAFREEEDAGAELAPVII
ncbi:MAG TPA: epoxide hydrolase [Polyangiaceae bacterium]